MTETNIGIDISKDHLDVHRLPGDERRRFDNSKAGLDLSRIYVALIAFLGCLALEGQGAFASQY